MRAVTTTYGVVAIVKNEAKNIPQMIESAGRYASVFTLVDTGSTDRTQDALFDAIQGRVGAVLQTYKRKWVDFGTNRSEAFALARDSADWLLALDADMQVDIDPAFEPDPAVDAYMVRVELEGSDIFYRLPLLLKGDRPWKSVGRIHEYTCLEDGTLGFRVETDLVVVRTKIDASPAKLKGYLAILLQERAEKPDDPRTTFYLAQTYRDLGMKEDALREYRTRAGMVGWDQEGFMAEYQAALLEPDQTVRWDALLRAWERRPCRLEPLQQLLRELNANSLHHTAWRLSAGPFSACTDIAFVQTWVWDWGMDFERSIAAWWTGNLKEFEVLTDKLRATPSLPAHIRAQVEANAAMTTRKDCC